MFSMDKLIEYNFKFPEYLNSYLDIISPQDKDEVTITIVVPWGVEFITIKQYKFLVQGINCKLGRLFYEIKN